jgi:hypothetical protein
MNLELAETTESGAAEFTGAAGIGKSTRSD